MSHHEVVKNNIKKEIIFSLVGVVLFAVLVVGVTLGAYLRPAGDHVDVAKLNATTQADVQATAPEEAKISSK